MDLGQWVSHQIRKIEGCTCTGNTRNVSPSRLQRKPLVSNSGMDHDTCVTHVPLCMSGSLTRGGGKTFPASLAHAQPAILRIWQEAQGEHVVPRKATMKPFKLALYITPPPPPPPPQRPTTLTFLISKFHKTVTFSNPVRSSWTFLSNYVYQNHVVHISTLQ